MQRFKASEYCPDFPEAPFDTLHESRRWSARYVGDRNGTHGHSDIKLFTLRRRHCGEDADLLARRHALH